MPRNALRIGIVFETYPVDADAGPAQAELRRQVVPQAVELEDAVGLPDPPDEVAHSPVKNVIRVYPDRIAFCVNNACAPLLPLLPAQANGGRRGLEGTSHFCTPIERGIELFRELHSRTSGFAISRHVLDTPDGKVSLDHPWARGRDGDDFVVETWTGQLWREPNPPD